MSAVWDKSVSINVSKNILHRVTTKSSSRNDVTGHVKQKRQNTILNFFLRESLWKQMERDEKSGFRTPIS